MKVQVQVVQLIDAGASCQVQVVKREEKVQVVQMQNGFRFNAISNDFPFLAHVQTSAFFQKKEWLCFFRKLKHSKMIIVCFLQIKSMQSVSSLLGVQCFKFRQDLGVQPNKNDTKWKVAFDWSMCCNTNWKQTTQLEN